MFDVDHGRLSLRTLEARLNALEDHMAIQRLQSLHAYHSGGGRAGDPEALARLFTEDGLWEVRNGGRFTGRPAIAEAAAAGAFRRILHLVATPDLAVRGDTAEGRWTVLRSSLTPTAEPHWSLGHYDVAYQRTPEGWRIARLTLSASAVPPPYLDGLAGDPGTDEAG